MKGSGGETRVTRKEPVCNVPVLVGGGCAYKIPQSCVLVKEEDDPLFCRKNTRVGVRLVAVETPEYGRESIRVLPLKRRPSSGAFTLTHTARVINRRSWRPLCGRKAMIQSPSWKHGGMTRTAGML